MLRVEGKTIVLGVTGGIAAYKACEIVRLLVKGRANVRVVMTQNSTRFVAPLTFETLSKNRVFTSTFDTELEAEIGHINLADTADAILIAPATANIIAKAACGIADDLLTTVLLATRSPVVVCPAMNVNMYSNPAVKENIERLKARGWLVVEPAEGELACGWEGAGRLEEPEVIIDHLGKALAPKDLLGQRVLVTAGATREAIDPVRFISNPSSGKMGYAIAKEAWMRGAEVTLVSGHSEVHPPKGVRVENAVSAEDMYRSVLANLDWATVIVKAAAVGDFAPSNPNNKKIKKKTGKGLTLALEPTHDILGEIGRRKGDKVLVGFAAETENIIENAKDKLRRKNADLIVANDVTKEGAGFGADTNIVSLIDSWGRVEELPLMTKEGVAVRIMDKVAELLAAKAAA
jgi:phosphopantothenoylcysteine decarboxylase/phosphopantothenate--cysteine ligase